MFKGFVLSESLKDPIILNKLESIKIIIEKHPEFKDESKIWHDFKLKIDDSRITSVCREISEVIKKGWYAHFWNDKIVYVVLPQKVFKIPREDGNWKSSEYQACKEYAIKHGIEERYIKDFWIED